MITTDDHLSRTGFGPDNGLRGAAMPPARMPAQPADFSVEYRSHRNSADPATFSSPTSSTTGSSKSPDPVKFIPGTSAANPLDFSPKINHRRGAGSQRIGPFTAHGEPAPRASVRRPQVASRTTASSIAESPPANSQQCSVFGSTDFLNTPVRAHICRAPM